MTIEVIIEAEAWDTLPLQALADAAESALFAELGLDPSAYEVALMAADDARIATLNATFRGKPVSTNVLSWPSQERAAEVPGDRPNPPEPGELGDIALAYGVCQSEAVAAGKPMADHVTHLTVHGLLHLLGYDHETDADAALMEGIEIRTLARMGLADPY